MDREAIPSEIQFLWNYGGGVLGKKIWVVEEDEERWLSWQPVFGCYLMNIVNSKSARADEMISTTKVQSNHITSVDCMFRV